MIHRHTEHLDKYSTRARYCVLRGEPFRPNSCVRARILVIIYPKFSLVPDTVSTDSSVILMLMNDTIRL